MNLDLAAVPLAFVAGFSGFVPAFGRSFPSSLRRRREAVEPVPSISLAGCRFRSRWLVRSSPGSP